MRATACQEECAANRIGERAERKEYSADTIPELEALPRAKKN
jgi:hypothetical protein